jgi:hypothetical protein
MCELCNFGEVILMSDSPFYVRVRKLATDAADIKCHSQLLARTSGSWSILPHVRSLASSTFKENIMKRFVMTIALTCALTGSVLAGDVPTVGVTPPTPDQPTIPTSPGDIPSVGLTQELSETALTLIQLAFGAVI